MVTKLPTPWWAKPKDEEKPEPEPTEPTPTPQTLTFEEASQVEPKILTFEEASQVGAPEPEVLSLEEVYKIQAEEVPEKLSVEEASQVEPEKLTFEEASQVEPLEEAPPEKELSAFDIGFGRSIFETNPRMLGKSLEAFHLLYPNIPGLDTVSKYLLDLAEESPEKFAEKPRTVGELFDPNALYDPDFFKWMSNVGTYLGEKAGEAVGQMLPIYGTGLAGAAIGGGAGALIGRTPAAAGVGARIGGVLGAAPGAYFLNHGDLYSSFEEAGMKPEHAAYWATAFAPYFAASEFIPIELGVQAALKPIKKEVMHGLATRVMKQMGLGGLAEGVQEGGQELAQKLLVEELTGKGFETGWVSEIIDAAITGALGGGMFRAPVGLVSEKKTPRPIEPETPLIPKLPPWEGGPPVPPPIAVPVEERAKQQDLIDEDQIYAPIETHPPRPDAPERPRTTDEDVEAARKVIAEWAPGRARTVKELKDAIGPGTTTKRANAVANRLIASGELAKDGNAIFKPGVDPEFNDTFDDIIDEVVADALPPEEQQEYVALEAEMRDKGLTFMKRQRLKELRSKINNSRMFSVPMHMFISTLEKSIQDTPTQRMSAKGWIDAINGLTKKGLTQNELKWTEVLDWLQEQGDRKVHKNELLDVIRGRKLVLTETVFGEPLTPEEQARKDELRRKGNLSREEIDELNVLTTKEKEPTPFAKYNPPAMTEYREIVIQAEAPSKPTAKQALMKKFPFRPPMSHYGGVFLNTLLHIRAGILRNLAGEKILATTEIQSDIDIARRKGAISPEEAENIAEQYRKAFSIEEKKTDVGTTYTLKIDDRVIVNYPTKEEAEEYIEKIIAEASPHTIAPDIPTDNIRLGILRMLRYAVDNGYDKLAFPKNIVQERLYGDSAMPLRPLYNEKIPNILRRLAKKWGGEVTEEQLVYGKPERDNAYFREQFNKASDTTLKNLLKDLIEIKEKLTVHEDIYAITEQIGNIKITIAIKKPAINSFVAYDEYLREKSKEYAELIDRYFPLKEETIPYTVVKITPEMREALQEPASMFTKVRSVLLTPQAVIRWKDYTDFLTNEIRRVSRGANIRFVQSLTAFQKEGEDSRPLNGVYDVTGRLVSIAMSAADPLFVAYHEVFHDLQAMGMLTKEEMRLLTDSVNKLWMDKYNIRERYKNEPGANLVYEAQADAFASWKIKGKSELGDLDVTSERVHKIFEKVDKFLTRIRNWWKGYGFNTAEDIFERVDKGIVGDRPITVDMRGAKNFVPNAARGALHANVMNLAKVITGQPGMFFSTPERGNRILGKAEKDLNKLVANSKFEKLPSELMSMLGTQFSPHHVAQVNPYFAPVYNVFSLMRQEQYKRISALSHSIKQFGRMMSKSESREKLYKVLEASRLQNEIPRAKNGLISFKVTDPRAELSQVGEVIELDKAETLAFLGWEKARNDGITILRMATMAKVGLPQNATRAMMVEKFEALENRAAKEEMKAAIEQVDQLEEFRKNAYVPFMRFGDYGVVVHGKEGEQVYFEKFETIGQAVNKARELVKRFPKEDGYKVSQPFNTTKDEMRKRLGDSWVNLEAIAALLTDESKSKYAEIRDDLITQIRKGGFPAHLMRSENIPGYSKNFEWAITSWLTSLAHYSTQLEYLRQAQEAVDAIPGEERRTHKYATKYVDYMLSPVYEYDAIRSMLFTVYLSSPASSLVNLITLPMIALPNLVRYSNIGRASTEMARAVADVAKMIDWNIFRKNFAEDLENPYIPISTSEKFTRHLKKDEAEAVREALLKGALYQARTFEFAGLEQEGLRLGAHYIPMNRAMRGMWRNSMRALTSLFALSEAYGRIVTFLAAYRLAQSKQVMDQATMELDATNPLWKEMTKGRKPTPYDFATWQVEQAWGIFGKLNRFPLMRGIGAPIFIFRSYPLQMMQMAARALITHKVPDNATPEQVRAVRAANRSGKKSAISLALAIFLLGGMWEEPGADDLRLIVEEILGLLGPKPDFKQEVRDAMKDIPFNEFLTDMVMHGGLNAIMGWGIEKRIGFGNFPVMSDILAVAGLKGDTRDLLGAPWSMVGGTVQQLINKIESGQPALSIASELTPALISNVLRAIDMMQRGVVSQRGEVIVPRELVEHGDIANRAFGMMSKDLSKRYEVYRSMKNAVDSVDTYQSSLRARQINYILEMRYAASVGDTDRIEKYSKKLQELWQEVQEHNKKMVEGGRLYQTVSLYDFNTVMKELVRAIYGREFDMSRIPIKARQRIMELGKFLPQYPTKEDED